MGIYYRTLIDVVIGAQQKFLVTSLPYGVETQFSVRELLQAPDLESYGCYLAEILIQTRNFKKKKRGANEIGIMETPVNSTAGSQQ